MKHMKKMLSILLATVMILSLGASVFAVGETPAAKAHEMEGPTTIDGGENKNGKITINDAIPRETYDLYQILYLESYSTTTGADGKTVTHYAYKANTSWNEFVNSAGIKGTYLVIDESGYVTWKEGADSAAFAKLALEYAQKDASGKMPGETDYTTPKINPVKSVTALEAEGADKKPTTKVKVEFTELKLGYYLIDTSLGSLCSLNTTDPQIEMQEKNEVPQNIKQVKEDSEDGWKGNEQVPGENHADIGQTVEFQSIVTVYPGTDNLIFHDQMSDGLTFTQADADAITVQLKNEAGSLNRNLVRETDFTVEFAEGKTATHVSEDITGNCTFHIRFSDEVFKTLSGNGTNTLTISYSATLNENAVIGVEGNPNTSMVSYGDDFHATPGSTTKTRTFGFPVFKYERGTNNPLSNTKFELHANGADNKPGDIIKLVNTGKKGENNAVIYRVATAKDIADSEKTDIPEVSRTKILNEIVTDETGRFIINGLDQGTYHLVETAPKPGYNKLKNPVVVSITYTPGEGRTDGTVEIKQDNKTIGADGVAIENGSGTELPSTGGVGTTIFYVVGGILAVGAVVLLVTKRRMNAAA